MVHILTKVTRITRKTVNQVRLPICGLVRLVTDWACAILDKHPITVLITLSLTVNFIIELLSRHSISELFSHILTKPHVFLINSAIIMCVYVLALLVRRRLFTVLMISALCVLCGIINCVLMLLRASPFTAHDISLVGYGIMIASVYISKPIIALIGIALFILAAAAMLLFFKLPKCAKRPRLRRVCGTIASCVLFAFLVSNANAVNLNIFAEYDNLIDAYDDMGFAYCFANSLLSSGISKPADYSEDSILGIVSNLGGEVSTPEKLPNIIFVQLESFFDPALLTGLVFSENPVPNFTALKENYPSGFLRVPSFGGGTANTEFEVLTGIPVGNFAIGEYPYDSVLREKSCESLAANLKSLGYTAHAVHNHAATFYSRNEVYSSLGFDRFIPLEYMHDTGYTPGGWAEDKPLSSCISESIAQTSGPDFVFAVTVQAHGRYPENYDNPRLELTLDEALAESVSPGSLEYFMTQLNATDAFIGSLISKINESGEDTVLVLYGDHLPPLTLVDEQLRSGSMYSTEYIIWSNVNLNAPDKDLDASSLAPYVLGLIGINNGIIMRLHQSGLDADYLSESVTLLAYDALYGEGYQYRGSFPYAPSALELAGTEEIRITSIAAYSLYVYISGENFTPFSTVYINGKRKETEFIGRTLLRVPYPLSSGDTISVKQCGMDKTVLGSTEEYVFDSRN